MNDRSGETQRIGGTTTADGDAALRPVGAPHEETVAGDERLRVQVLAAEDGRYAYRAQCGYQACDGPFRDTVTSVERFDSVGDAMDAGIVRARQLAGIDAPEA